MSGRNIAYTVKPEEAALTVCLKENDLIFKILQINKHHKRNSELLAFRLLIIILSEKLLPFYHKH